jgi:hypothetical protein
VEQRTIELQKANEHLRVNMEELMNQNKAFIEEKNRMQQIN